MLQGLIKDIRVTSADEIEIVWKYQDCYQDLQSIVVLNYENELCFFIDVLTQAYSHVMGSTAHEQMAKINGLFQPNDIVMQWQSASQA